MDSHPPAPETWLPPVDRRALAVFAALVIILLAPWPGWGRAFAKAFGVFGNGLVVVAGPWDGPPPRFEVPPPGDVSARDGGPWAVVLSSNRGIPLDTRIIAYTPLAIFLALALATPVARRRKLIILAGGFACLLVRLAFAVLVPLDRAFAGGRSGSTLAELAAVVWTVFVTPPVMSYATPLVVWWLGVALTTARRAEASRGAGRSRTRGRRDRRGQRDR
jgi:hypothetical protein